MCESKKQHGKSKTRTSHQLALTTGHDLNSTKLHTYRFSLNIFELRCLQPVLLKESDEGRLEGVKARSNKDQPPTQTEMKLTLHNENLPIWTDTTVYKESWFSATL